MIRKKVRTAALFTVLAVLCTGCGSGEASESDGQGVYSESSEAANAEPSVMGIRSDMSEEPFVSYTFEFKGLDANYMLTVGTGDNPDEISVSIENNRYLSTDFVITAPAGYLPSFPYSQQYAESCVGIITNDIDESRDIPDIMEFVFFYNWDSDNIDAYTDEYNNVIYEENGSEVKMPYRISKYYTVADNQLRQINIAEHSEDGDITSDYLSNAMLYHTEADKFIYRITVDDSIYDDEEDDERDISDKVKISTLTFDESIPEFISGYEEISEDNSLYFGYAWWSAANNAAQYFTVTTLNVTDFDNYIEKRSEDGEMSEYYFKIDDPRFDSVDDLRSWLCDIFSENIADELIRNAPQKYCDIDGSLYGIVGDGGYDDTLGTLTFSDTDISEDRMVFRSRQEKFDDTGRFSGYTDGGTFVITRSDGQWKVTEYRYPYSP
ncbi:MAG: hypothetical protein ACI4SF_06105 [Oscillospiraceae bacterium]